MPALLFITVGRVLKNVKYKYGLYNGIHVF